MGREGGGGHATTTTTTTTMAPAALAATMAPAVVPDGVLTSSSQQLPLLDIPRPFDPLSDVSNDSSHNGRDCESQEAALSERLGQQPSPFSGPASVTNTALTVPGVGPASPGHTGLGAPRDKSPSLHSKSKKKSKKHKDKDKSKEREQERERRVAEERGAEPKRSCDLISSSPENTKSSIPHRSTGTREHTENAQVWPSYGSALTQRGAHAA